MGFITYQKGNQNKKNKGRVSWLFSVLYQIRLHDHFYRLYMLELIWRHHHRCTFKDHLQKLEHNDDSEEHTDKNLLIAQSLASKILSNANFHLVSMDMPVTFSIEDASGLCWRFSSEILSTSNPCLITILAEGHISEPLDLTAKVNSEDTAFGLNLLNRVVAIIEWSFTF